jgi:hypothetical protein
MITVHFTHNFDIHSPDYQITYAYYAGDTYTLSDDEAAAAIMAGVAYEVHPETGEPVPPEDDQPTEQQAPAAPVED